MTRYWLLGSIGAGCLLLAFLFLTLGKIHRDNLSYQVLNIAGSAVLIVYSYLLESYPFLVLNIAWLLAAFFGLTKVAQKRRDTVL